MFKVGDLIKYKESSGEVLDVFGDVIIVKLADGKEYTLPADAISLVEAAPAVVISPFKRAIDSIRPHLKDINFLNELAKISAEAGVSEIHIRNGSIQNFHAKESLEEKIKKYTDDLIAKAKAEAEGKAREEYERENS
jgi:small-conductance mechanosensitive channel